MPERISVIEDLKLMLDNPNHNWTAREEESLRYAIESVRKGLTDEMIERNREIVYLREQGETFKSIGLKVGLSATTVMKTYERFKSPFYGEPE